MDDGAFNIHMPTLVAPRRACGARCAAGTASKFGLEHMSAGQPTGASRVHLGRANVSGQVAVVVIADVHVKMYMYM